MTLACTSPSKDRISTSTWYRRFAKTPVHTTSLADSTSDEMCVRLRMAPRVPRVESASGLTVEVRLSKGGSWGQLLFLLVLPLFSPLKLPPFISCFLRRSVSRLCVAVMCCSCFLLAPYYNISWTSHEIRHLDVPMSLQSPLNPRDISQLVKSHEVHRQHNSKGGLYVTWDGRTVKVLSGKIDRDAPSPAYPYPIRSLHL